uniref:Cytochrome c biogenesis protein CcsA n=1 Tax=Helminthora furcellata TaxID=1884666 RepID=A0A1G4NR24_9FLOR|nr:Cytochrome c biogenesis protein ccs1 [Helminthora furcellata]SCW21101.1 Cytochrome c biogenesis protein ccs1 [Helminthora furcellata]SCW23961.1 Cytochrome c biogenesis protein ccs1 [Helminthora furcellata]
MEWNIVHNQLINTSFLILLINLLICWTTIAFPYFKFLKTISKSMVIIVNVLLAIILGSRWIINGYFPLSNLYESLIFLTWCLTFTQILINQQIKSQIINAVSLPIDLFIIAFASISLPQEMQKASPLVPALHSNWLMMHVTVMILSYAFLLIGSLLSILFLIITQGKSINLKGDSSGYLSNDTQIKTNTVPLLYNDIQTNSTLTHSLTSRMSLLESLDNLSYRIIGLGFPLLTVGIISGAVWANEAWGSYWSWDPKETWALITWLVFASYLHSRLTKSWAGKKPALLASVGFFVVWVCYLGVNFLGQGLHSYGWVS